MPPNDVPSANVKMNSRSESGGHENRRVADTLITRLVAATRTTNVADVVVIVVVAVVAVADEAAMIKMYARREKVANFCVDFPKKHNDDIQPVIFFEAQSATLSRRLKSKGCRRLNARI